LIYSALSAALTIKTMKESYDQFISKKISETEQKKEALEKAGGVTFERENDPESGEEKCYVNFFGRRLETLIRDEEEFNRIRESVNFSELDEKMFSRIAEAYTLGHSLMLEGDPGAGKTFAYSKFNEFLKGGGRQPIILTCTPKMSELEIIGHWVPAPGGRESPSPAVKAAYARYDTAKRTYDQAMAAHLADPKDEVVALEFEQARSFLQAESDILRAETEGQVEWSFKKGALLEAYTGDNRRGRMLVVDEFNLLPSNVQQAFLKTISSGGRIADTIQELSNSQQNIYHRGPDTYICYAQNFPEKTRGRNVVAAPMTDRVEWYTIPRELVDAKEGAFIESWGGALEDGHQGNNVELIVRVNLKKHLLELLDGSVVRIFGGLTKKFHQEYKRIISSSPDKFGEDERTQELETSTRRFLHTANHMEHFLIQGEDGMVDLQKTLKDAITKNYIDRIYDSDLHNKLTVLLDSLLTGRELGIIEFEGQMITAAKALDTLRERLSREEYKERVGLETVEELEKKDLIDEIERIKRDIGESGKLPKSE
jgi:hypothetical protein